MVLHLIGPPCQGQYRPLSMASLERLACVHSRQHTRVVFGGLSFLVLYIGIDINTF